MITRRKWILRNGLLVPFLAPIIAKSATIIIRGPNAAAASVGAPGGGGASFAFVQKTHSTSDPNSATQSVSLTGVTAGNLIIVGAKSEGGNGLSVTGISDGTSAFTVGTKTDHANNDLHWVYGYLLSSVASGNVTYTVTYSGGSGAFFWTFAFEFSGGGTRAFDAENGASGTSAAVNSGQITTGAAVSLVLGSYGHYSGSTLTSIQIGGVNKDGCEPDTPGASQSAMWYRILSSVMTNGAATGSITSAEWVSRILSIKAT